MQAVILAAGEGIRLRPLTENRPKVLLPIVNKPLIDYQLELLKKLKIDDIAIVVGYKKEKIIEHLKNKGVKFFVQEKQLGTAHALAQVKNFVKDKFLLIYGDLFFTDSLKKLISYNKPTLSVVKVKDVSRFGKVEIKNGKVVSIKEKVAEGEGMINAGIYILFPEIFDAIEKTELSERKEYELTDSLMKLKEVYAYPLEGYWSDIGYPWEYLDVNFFMLSKIKFFVGKNTKIWKNATLKKPVIIGDNCEIKNCVIENSVIGDNCKIGEFSIVKRSIVMNGSKVPHLNYVADSIIGENCNLGAGTITANLKFTGGNVKVNIKGKRIGSGRRKLGVIMGDDVKTGVNVSFYPGVKVGSNCWIDAEVLVREDVQGNSYVKLEQKIKLKKLKFSLQKNKL
jgi:bifunctional UDP-N-acetylglucosamine pyrophosphorylase/glucosamine-1-phosphate N-acetyltransferase